MEGSSLALDKDSEECLRCHFPAIANEFTGKVCPLPDCDHPVGVDYYGSSATNPGLTPPAALNPAMKLPDNKIGCRTCHVPYSPGDHSELARIRKTRDPASTPDPMLVVDNRRSGLCLNCHKK